MDRRPLGAFEVEADFHLAARRHVHFALERAVAGTDDLDAAVAGGQPQRTQAAGPAERAVHVSGHVRGLNRQTKRTDLSTRVAAAELVLVAVFAVEAVVVVVIVFVAVAPFASRLGDVFGPAQRLLAHVRRRAR